MQQDKSDAHYAPSIFLQINPDVPAVLLGSEQDLEQKKDSVLLRFIVLSKMVC